MTKTITRHFSPLPCARPSATTASLPFYGGCVAKTAVLGLSDKKSAAFFIGQRRSEKRLAIILERQYFEKLFVLSGVDEHLISSSKSSARNRASTADFCLARPAKISGAQRPRETRKFFI